MYEALIKLALGHVSGAMCGGCAAVAAVVRRFLLDVNVRYVDAPKVSSSGTHS